MKTKIITLESHDDLISVRDKLSWAKTPRILLVWPKYEKVTLRLLDLKVLQRHADSLGAQLGLVTKWMNVRRDAESLGIPVFASTASAQKDAWAESLPRVQRIPKPPRKGLRKMQEETHLKEEAWRSSLLGRVITFTTGVMAVLALAGLFIPRAAVTLNPEAQTVSLVIPVNASPSFETVSLSGEIPAQTISVIVGGEQMMLVSSNLSIPKTKATGIVQFTNLGSDKLTVPAGTIVATESFIRFATLEETTLPADADKFIEIKIEALEAGEEGNVAAGAISVIEGTLGLSVKILNLEPTTGGTNEDVIGSTEEDRAVLREMMLNGLRVKAEGEARANIGEGDLFITDTLKVGEIQKEEFTPPPGEPGAELTLSIQVEFTARYILASDLKALASSALTASIPPGFSPDGEMLFSPLEAPITDSTGITRFALQASQATLRNVDLIQVFDLIRGREARTAALAIKETFLLQNEPQIVITPSWWPWLPLIPFNISVEVK